jgi:uncharacterized protein (DUF2141 family)
MPWALFLLFGFSLSLNQDLTLRVTITHVKTGRGSIYTSIWSDRQSFFKKPFLSESRKADHDSLQFVFKLKPGEYAISVFQDLNENQKLDQGLFGIPKEPVGFGNNFKPKFSAPEFSDCSFKMTQDIQMVIGLH